MSNIEQTTTNLTRADGVPGANKTPERLYRISGDTLTAFGEIVALPDGYDLENDERLRETIAHAIGLTRYGREQDFNICNVIEVDANGNELPLSPTEKAGNLFDPPPGWRPKS